MKWREEITDEQINLLNEELEKHKVHSHPDYQKLEAENKRLRSAAYHFKHCRECSEEAELCWVGKDFEQLLESASAETKCWRCYPDSCSCKEELLTFPKKEKESSAEVNK